jgi:hypothetical protein
MDFNDIKRKTDIEIKRLGWSSAQGREFLMSRYGKRSRLELTDEQLLEFLRYLETLPNLVKSGTGDQGREFLTSRYGKRNRLHLTDEQLLEFLRYLETLPNPVK